LIVRHKCLGATWPTNGGTGRVLGRGHRVCLQPCPTELQEDWGLMPLAMVPKRCRCRRQHSTEGRPNVYNWSTILSALTRPAPRGRISHIHGARFSLLGADSAFAALLKVCTLPSSHVFVALKRNSYALALAPQSSGEDPAYSRAVRSSFTASRARTDTAQCHQSAAIPR
jgi:hypothetical protein